MRPSTSVSEPIARPPAVGSSPLALPPQVVHEIANVVIDAATASQVQISEFGALLLALAADGSPNTAVLLLQQAMFDAAGKACYEEDSDAVMPLDDASVQETLANLGYDVYDGDAAPSAELHVPVSPGASAPVHVRDLLGGRAHHVECPERRGGLPCDLESNEEGRRGSRRSPSREGYGYGRRRGVGHARGLPRALPNVRRGLGVRRRSS